MAKIEIEVTKIQKILIERGLTQTDLYELIKSNGNEIGKDRINRIVNGKLTNFHTNTAKILAKALGVKIDDVVGAIPVHGFAGIFGTLVVPLSNSAASFGTQLYGILWVNIFVFIIAFVVWYLMKITMGIRISEEAEKLGTDKAEVGVMAYMIRD